MDITGTHLVFRISYLVYLPTRLIYEIRNTKYDLCNYHGRPKSCTQYEPALAAPISV